MDGSPKSLDDSLFQTNRHTVLNIEPMTRKMIWKLNQLQDLFKYVKEAGLDDVVFSVLGGIPYDYENLSRCTKGVLKNDRNVKQYIGNYLRDEISLAIELIEASKKQKEIIKLFDKKKNCLPVHLLKEKGLIRPTPDHIFRKASKNGKWALIPASNAIGIVLRHNLCERPTLQQLEELVKRENHEFDEQ